MDKNQRKLAEARLKSVSKIVERTLINQPSVDVAKLTHELLMQFALNDCVVVVCGGHSDNKQPDIEHRTFQYSPKSVSIEREIVSEASPAQVASATIEAPFPESAMGGDSYDPIELTACLPEFDRLPTEFNDKFSAIRTGDKTVVMNSAHYADLLQARDTAIKAREDADVMKQAAIAAIQPLSDMETIARQTKGRSFMLFGNADGTFSVIADDAVETGPNARQLLRTIAEKITNPVPEVVDIPEVSSETTYQSGVEEVPCQVEQASGEEKCQTEPVDSAGQAGATQDTKESTSEQF